MRKLLLAAIISFIATPFFTASAQDEKPNRMILHYKSGETQTFNLTDLDYMEFDRVDTPDPQPAEPKVGDYFYSDGTWSDGGLVSIDPNGCNAVWSATKPAPIEGKTVVGIVFSTNPDRIADADKEAGFTHGYVIACKNIQDPGKSNFASYPETVWYAGQYAKTDCIKVSKLAKSCYSNLNGREETTTLLANNDEQYYKEDLPMFYYGTKTYPVEAPANTSGWFIPSVGQMWDCIANFCSGEVAAFLAENTELGYDFTYYLSKQCANDVPFDKFMEVFSLVPEADEDEMTIPDGTKYMSIATSSRYDEESRVIFNIGMNGNTLIEGMAGWFDEEAHARPILAF